MFGNDTGIEGNPLLNVEPLEPPSSDGLAVLYCKMVDDKDENLRRREMALLFALAEHHLETEQTDRASGMARDALFGFRDLGDKVARADCLRLLIHCFRQQNKLNFAKTMALEELVEFDAPNDAMSQARVHLSLGEICCAQQNREEAMGHSNKAMAAFREAGDPRMEALALLLLADIHQMARDGNRKAHIEEAMSAAKQAQTLFEDLKDWRGSGRALHRLARVHFARREYQDGNTCSDQALEVFRRLGDRKMEAFELNYRAMVRLDAAGEAGDALPDAQKALAIVRDIGWGRQWEANALSAVVRAHASKQQPQRALQVVRDGLQHLRMQGDRHGEAQALEALVSANLANQSWPAALRAAERACAEMRSLGHAKMEMMMLRTVSQLSIELWHLDRGLEAAQEALSVSRELGTNIGECMLQVARAHLALDEYDAAVVDVEEAKDLFISAGDKRNEAVSHMVLGLVQTASGEANSAGSAYADAVSLFRGLGDERGEAMALLRLCQVNKTINDLGRAQTAAKLARKLCEETGDRPLEVQALLDVTETTLLRAMEAKGEPSWHEECTLQALAAAGEAVSICREDEDEPEHDRELLGRSLIWLARARLTGNRLVEAMEDIQEAKELFRLLGAPGWEAEALIVCAQAHCRMYQPEDAWRSASDAHALFVGTGDETGTQQAVKLLEFLASVDEGSKTEQSAAAPEPVSTDNTSLVEQRRQPTDIERFDATAGVSRELVLEKITEIMQGMGIMDDVESDSPLLQAGLSSSTSHMARSMISDAFSGAKLPFTLVFDYPSMNDITDLIMGQIKDVSAAG